MTKTGIIIISAIILLSCGFHLRGSGSGSGSYNFPSWLDAVYVRDSSATGLGKALERNLAANNIKLAGGGAADSGAKLEITAANFTRTAAVLDSITGRPSRYNVGLNGAYRILPPKSRPPVSGSFNVSESYEHDANNINVNDVKEREIRTRLIEQAAGNIIRHLSRIAKRK